MAVDKKVNTKEGDVCRASNSGCTVTPAATVGVSCHGPYEEVQQQDQRPCSSKLHT